MIFCLLFTGPDISYLAVGRGGHSTAQETVIETCQGKGSVLQSGQGRSYIHQRPKPGTELLCVSEFPFGNFSNHKFYAWDSVSVMQFVFLSLHYDLYCTPAG
jgi:hypothetical protein